MFALRVWVGFGASLRGVFIKAHCDMFGRTHDIMFGRTFFEDCVRKDTFQNMMFKTF